MVPKQPPKRTATRPGLGIDDALPRLESAELQKVRDSFEKDVKGESTRDSQPEAAIITPPPQSRARVPREDDDVPPDSVPRSDRFLTKRDSAPKRDIPTSRAPGSISPRQHTNVGLGSKTHPQSRPAEVARRPNSNPAGPISRPPSSKPGRWQDEAPSGPRSRKPLTVDSVGENATRLARNTVRGLNAPKVIATQAVIASAPLDSRTAFVLSLVDGSSDVPAIVDATGMPEDEVIGILARLARLGLISVP